jgi:glycosyltransferase involved in cell wall biosynthesis
VRILCCATQAPLPPINGYRLQLVHVTRELARANEVCVLAFRAPDQEGEVAAGVELLPVQAPAWTRSRRISAYARSLAGGQPRRAARLGTPMAAAIRSLLAERSFDVAHVTPGSLAGVARELDAIPRVLAPLDAWHLNLEADARAAPALQRPFYQLEARRVRRFAAHTYRAFQRVVTVSQEDADALAELDPSLALEVIPNGVDSDTFAPNPDVEPDPGHIVFTGAMSWAANVTAAQTLALEVLPRVRRRRPDAHLSLVGRDPRPDVLDLGDIEGVHVTGSVPDIRPWLWRAEVYACPMTSGTGIKNKLLEALATASPCVATPLSCQGTALEHERDLLVARDADETAEAILRLFEDADLRRRLGQAGRDYVVERHSWASVAREFERVYREAGARS